MSKAANFTKDQIIALGNCPVCFRLNCDCPGREFNPVPDIPEKKARKKRVPNKTEAEYGGALSNCNDIVIYEGITINLANGHRYTPDWYVVRNKTTPYLEIECHEVKGGYRFASYGRSRLAFDQAKLEHPEIIFVWATKTPDGWKVEQ